MSLGTVNGHRSETVQSWAADLAKFTQPFTGAGGLTPLHYGGRPDAIELALRGEMGAIGVSPWWDPGGLQGLALKLRGTEQIERPLVQSWLISACADRRATELSGMPLVLWRDRSDDASRVEDGPLFELLKRPTPLTSQREWVYALDLMRMHDGDVFLVLTDDRNAPIRAGQMPTRMWPVRGAHFEADIDTSTGLPRRWLYGANVASKVEHSYEPHQVVQLPIFNLYNTLRGIGPVGIALRLANQDYQIDRLTDALTQSGGNPPCVFASDNVIGPEQATQARESIDKRRNAGQVLVLPNGLKPVPTAFSPVEMAMPEGRAWIRDAVMAIFGVTKPLLSITDDVNRANAREAIAVFVENVVLPKARILEDQLQERLLVPMGMGDLAIGFDTNAVGALKATPMEKAELMAALKLAGLKPIAAARIAGFEDITEADIEPPPPPPTFGGPSKDFRAPKAITLALEPERAAEWHAYAASVEKPEAAIKRDVLRIRAEYVAALAESWRAAADGPMAGPHRMASQSIDVEALAIELAAYMPDPQRFIEAMRKSLAQNLAGVFEVQTAEMARRLGKTVAAFARDDVLATAFLSTKPIKVAEGVISTLAVETRRQMARILADEGYTVQSIASGIREQLAKLDEAGEIAIRYQDRALTIARTETGAVANFARFGEMQAQGLTHHQWVSSRDGHVRDSHAVLDGQIVAIGAPFSNGLRYPLDTNGGPGDVINCRCLAIPVEAP